MIRAIRHHTPVGVLPLLLSDVTLLSTCFYMAAGLLYPPSGWYYLFYEGGVTPVAFAVLTIIVAMYFFNMYAEVRVSSRILLSQQIAQALGAAIIAQTVAAYVFRGWTVPRMLMLYGCGLILVAMFCWRLAFSSLIRRVAMQGKLLILGRSATSEAVARAVDESNNTGFRVIGFLGDSPAEWPLLGEAGGLRAAVEEHKPNLLVVGLPERRKMMPIADLVALRFAGLHIEEASQTFESVYQRVSLPDLSEQEALFSRAFVPSARSLNLARASDLLLAAFCLLLFSPVMLLIAAWLKVGTSGPVLVKERFAGPNGRSFLRLRFRPDPAMLGLLHRFHLNSLPELLNVFRGEMSLVGPRPETPETARSLSESLPFYSYRTAVPPGVTGWAQIHATDDNRGDRQLALEYDLYYLKNMSLALNLYILVHSLKNRVLYDARP